MTAASNRRHLQSAPRSSQERRNRRFPRQLPGTSLVCEGWNRYLAGSRIRDRITEPVLAPIRSFMPNLGGLDISPIILILIIILTQKLIAYNLMPYLV